jgi:hypothetical protein
MVVGFNCQQRMRSCSSLLSNTFDSYKRHLRSVAR